MGTIMEQVANVDSHDRFKMMFRHLRTEYEKRGLPLKGTFELTPHCTLDCKMCYVHRSDGKYPHRVLTGDEWINIMDQAIELGMLEALLTGGECMLHPDFKRIYMHLKKKGVYVLLISNATLIDQDIVELFKAYPPSKLNITVYGSNPQVYEQVTGHAEAFAVVNNALNMLREANISYNIQHTFSKYNLDDAQALLEYSQMMKNGEVQIDTDLFDPIDNCGNEYSKYALSFEERWYLESKLQARKGRSVGVVCDEDFLRAKVDTPQPSPTLNMPCIAGITAFHVNYYGIMAPCGNFPLVLEDVTKERVQTAWNEIHRVALSYTRSEECVSCEFFGKCSFCPARYAMATGSKNGLAGVKPCDKKYAMLLPTFYTKLKEN
ncbi:MAG: radical SAM protein [Clostridia bacterium]|nr:radical SAM protein [Clostridia bacterium]